MSDVFRFDQPACCLTGRRIKAGFHCHTTHSDGGMSVRETVDRYRSKGFECVGITDHRQVTPVEDIGVEDCIAIAATENGGQPDIIGVGVETAVEPDLPLAERAAMLAGQGGFTIAAHPTYCGVLPADYVDCPHLMAMEIYNAYCDAAYANGYALELWDMVLGQGKRIWGVAGDDAHLNPRKRYYSDAGLGWVEIWADDISRQPVVNALKEGAFFSTQGPVFDSIEVQADSISVTCSPVSQIRWRTFGKVGYVVYAEAGTTLTRASLPDGFRPDTFVRIELVDQDGRRAWSNPVFVHAPERAAC